MQIASMGTSVTSTVGVGVTVGGSGVNVDVGSSVSVGKPATLVNFTNAVAAAAVMTALLSIAVAGAGVLDVVHPDRARENISARTAIFRSIVLFPRFDFLALGFVLKL
jgi:hypothetical protein